MEVREVHAVGQQPTRCNSSLSSINDYDFTTRRMDIDAPRPRCPFCGQPMRFRFNELSTLQTFDCKGCQVVLNIPWQASVSGIAVPALARE
jgi:transposase-like protein